MKPLTSHPDFGRLRRLLDERRREFKVAFRGDLFRIVSIDYARAADLLSGEGARRFGGRYNPPEGFRCVYLSLDLETAFGEANSWFEQAGIPLKKALPRVEVAVGVTLSKAFDLRDGKLRQTLRISRERLVETDWERTNGAGDEAVTQALGRAVFELGFEGLVFPSAARGGAGNLAVFPENLLKKSRLRATREGKLP